MQSRLASDLLTSNTVVKLNKFCKNESYCLKTQHSKPSKPTPDNSRDLMWHFMSIHHIYITHTARERRDSADRPIHETDIHQ